MTPLEKAKKLFEDMKGGCCNCTHDSKEAAITCCDEVLQTIAQNGVIYPHREYENVKDFWTSVKSEVEKL